jgi:hypothetical protein
MSRLGSDLVSVLVVLAASTSVANAQCAVLYEGSCGTAGQNISVKNNSTANSFKATIEDRKNGNHFRTDIFDLAAGERDPINLCTKNGTDTYTAQIVGCQRL